MRSETTEKQIASLYAFRDTIPADRPLAIENCDRAIDELLAEDDIDPAQRAADELSELIAEWADDTDASNDTTAGQLTDAGYGSAGIL